MKKKSFLSNCLFYAVTKFVKEKNGYLVMRKSKEGWYPHFLFMDENKKIRHFQPVVREIYKWLPPLIFRGFIKKHDNNKRRNMRAASKWRNPKHSKRLYVGNYDRAKKTNARIFVLTCKENGVVVDVETFESHEKAKALKWVKVK